MTLLSHGAATPTPAIKAMGFAGEREPAFSSVFIVSSMALERFHPVTTISEAVGT